MIELPEIALSIRQPWAWAVIHAGKDIENRGPSAIRYLNHAGRICVHAASGMTRAEYDVAAAFMASIGVKCPPPAELPRGAIIGTVEVTTIVIESNSPWFFGPCGLVLINPAACDVLAATGALGFFNWRKIQPHANANLQVRSAAKWMLNWGTNHMPKEHGRNAVDSQRALVLETANEN
jgi:hypothetical protein